MSIFCRAEPSRIGGDAERIERRHEEMTLRIVDYLFTLALIWWWAGSIGQAMNFALLERLDGREARLEFIRTTQRRYDHVLLLPGIGLAGGLFVAATLMRPVDAATLATFSVTWSLNILSGLHFHPRIYAAVEASETGKGDAFQRAMRAHAVEGVLAFASGFAFLWFYLGRVPTQMLADK